MHNKKFFVTYGDNKFEDAKKIITKQAELTGEFDSVFAYGENDVSEELKESAIFKIKRGGGVWSWKPDVIWQSMQRFEEGDVIVYCDAGCTLQKAKEWKWYWKKLKKHDIIAQRILMRNDHYTRKELLDQYMGTNGKGWSYCYQYQATVVVVVVSDFTRCFIKEWRDLMIKYPTFAMDVTEEERNLQHPTLIENRHDQAIYSTLIYKYLNNPETRNKIYTCWERIEDLHPFRKQAIRATRLRHGERETNTLIVERIIKRLVKEYFLIPFYYSPRQFWYSKKQ